MRVCKVLKCQEIRKSHSCYKLTLSDGLDKRTIVSSIKAYYTPEELVGKKIIVLANLKPTRITGVTSEGMLLAATNNACGCKVILWMTRCRREPKFFNLLDITRIEKGNGLASPDGLQPLLYPKCHFALAMREQRLSLTGGGAVFSLY